ncbi:hypothetical protein [Streptomyces sp. NPDC091219]|uniref:hypothetical protein n=1 Tax=Streptomyces sp. NPDC091219 TaxID=3155193 RepID=UPI00344EF986
MGVPSAPQPGPQSWVRGPKPTHPATDDTPAAPPAGQPAHSSQQGFGGGLPSAPVREAAPAAQQTRSAVQSPPAGPEAPAGQSVYPAPQGFGGGLPSAPVREAVPAAQAQAAVQPAPRPLAPAAPRPAAPTAPRPASPAARRTAAPGQTISPRQAARPSNSPARKTTSGRPVAQDRGPSKRGGAARGRSREDVGWVKAHGGSGATSLADALGGVDVGARWPEPARGEPYRIVLVGRTSASGLRSVSQALGQLKDGKAPQGLELLAVVLVADAPGRLPLGLLRRIRVLRSVARVHRVPWIPAWRTDSPLKYIPRQLVTLSRLVGSDVYGEGAMK